MYVSILIYINLESIFCKQLNKKFLKGIKTLKKLKNGITK